MFIYSFWQAKEKSNFFLLISRIFRNIYAPEPNPAAPVPPCRAEATFHTPYRPLFPPGRARIKDPAEQTLTEQAREIHRDPHGFSPSQLFRFPVARSPEFPSRSSPTSPRLADPSSVTPASPSSSQFIHGEDRRASAPTGELSGQLRPWRRRARASVAAASIPSANPRSLPFDLHPTIGCVPLRLLIPTARSDLTAVIISQMPQISDPTAQD